MKMHVTLFEFQSASPEQALDPARRARLEAFLDGVWNRRARLEFDPGTDSGRQPFLAFDGGRFTAQHYVGFVQFEDVTIEILPKIFENTGLDRADMLRHVLFWLENCRRLHLPHLTATLDGFTAETLSELMCYWFGRLALDRLTRYPYAGFEEVRETLGAPRGQVQFGAWAGRELPRGQFHRFECVYAPLASDNIVNRAVRQASSLLYEQARQSATRSLLLDVLRRLDGISPAPPVTANDLERLRLPAFYAAEYTDLLAWCARIIEQQPYGTNRGASPQWSFLLPMPYVFEEFVAGFLEQHFRGAFQIVRQPADVHLATEAASGKNRFLLRPDLVLTDRASGRKIIVDTKYKQRRQRGIDPGDMYQLVAYALRHDAHTAVLAYPGEPHKAEAAPGLYHVPMPGGHELRVWALDLPMWSTAGIRDADARLKAYLTRFFAG